jgi:1-deoxy-D-xylulose-5-phosphate reductoisomerase
MGGTTPAVLNAADEVLVAAFLEERIRFDEIAKNLSRILDEYDPEPADDLETILRADELGRTRARTLTGLA